MSKKKLVTMKKFCEYFFYLSQNGPFPTTDVIICRNDVSVK